MKSKRVAAFEAFVPVPAEGLEPTLGHPNKILHLIAFHAESSTKKQHW
jgi:hypothetical protein